ncbi:jg21099 [Pararge aegeria aegeria]|uniref:Jg21099 protein n=1 Tax=Pararge aegeria aegeria TaxID=348720 RepID=A0A8S4RNB8_9NEOP|nr:jg21099 [Pararge aegeria aegeria]
MFVTRLIYFFVLFITTTSCDQFNLYGQAGQAYALEINVGHPVQKLNVLVDTGSTTLAIASYARIDSNKYFHADNSASLFNIGKEVQAKYSQGTWIGNLVSDFVNISTLPEVPEVKCDIALITKSHKFFMNGSGWQGLLGLAYLPVGAWGENVVVGSWLDSVEKALNKAMSFQLKLCGVRSSTNATHYGKLEMLDDNTVSLNHNVEFRTPILRKRWYEVGVLSIRVITNGNKSMNIIESNLTKDSDDYLNAYKETCVKLNEEKSIVDSGTTNIRLPDTLFGENFMRVVTAKNNSGEGGSVSEFCYKLGFEAGGKETILGYTAMEGLQVLFNRSAGWIGWYPSDCGPKARVTGPYNFSTSLLSLCQLTQPVPDVAVSIKAAQWTLCAVSIIAAAVLIYLLAPCVKIMIQTPLPMSQQISLSQAALVEQEAT